MKIPVDPLVMECIKVTSPLLELEVTQTMHYMMELGLLQKLGGERTSFEPDDVSSQLLIATGG